jgi:hypothetical protein
MYGAWSFSGNSGGYAVSIVSGGTTGQAYGLLVIAGTNSSDYAMMVETYVGSHPLLSLAGDGSGSIGYHPSNVTIGWNATGNVTVYAPSSGTALTVNAVSTSGGIALTGAVGSYPITFTDGTHQGGFFISGTTGVEIEFGSITAHGIAFFVGNGSPTFSINNNGNAFIGPPASGPGLTVTTISDNQLILNAQTGGRYTTLGFNVNSVSKLQMFWDNVSGVFYIAPGPGGISVAAPTVTASTLFLQGVTSGGAPAFSMAGGTSNANYCVVCANAAGNANLLLLYGNGQLQLPYYGFGAASFSATGLLISASDERVKTHIRTFPRGLAEILALRPILHGWTPESGIDITGKDDYAGFSAQNVQGVIPEAVGKNRDGTLSLSDRAILAALVNAVKELATFVKSPTVAAAAVAVVNAAITPRPTITTPISLPVPAPAKASPVP